MERRHFLKLSGTTVAALGVPGAWPGLLAQPQESDVLIVDPEGLGTYRDRLALRIEPVELEIAQGRVLKTIGYNGSSPGPVLRMREGVPTAFEVHNASPKPEFVHPHGQHLAAEVDGTHQEGSPAVEPGQTRRFIFKPGPAGTRWYHSHAHTNGDRTRGLYSGQHGVLLVEPRRSPGAYDREVVLITHEWKEFLRETMGKDVPGPTYSINGRALGHGEPIRVSEGERMLFRIVNGNAEEEIFLALPGHEFEVIAMDGNPVPRPGRVRVLRLGSGERIDALVRMTSPGVWVLGDTRKNRRGGGLGIVVEYADHAGEPCWSEPSPARWDYTVFGGDSKPRAPDETIKMVFDKGEHEGDEVWRVNGKPFDAQDPYQLRLGRRYRLVFIDRSDRLHPLHLHRHSFEVTRIDGTPTAGLIKDTVCIEPNGRVEVDFTADQPGLSLFHCHMQNHMDNGFASLFQTR